MLELQWVMKENLCLSDFSTVMGANSQQTNRKEEGKQEGVKRGSEWRRRGRKKDSESDVS